MRFLWFLIIGLLAGWLAGQIMRGRSFGVLGNLVVGIVGAFIGGILFSLIGLSTHDVIGELISATAGAVVLLFLAGLLKK